MVELPHCEREMAAVEKGSDVFHFMSLIDIKLGQQLDRFQGIRRLRCGTMHAGNRMGEYAVWLFSGQLIRPVVRVDFHFRGLEPFIPADVESGQIQNVFPGCLVFCQRRIDQSGAIKP
ncbi:hypothetical protein SDC9_198735 [bioreactor metagenome]|uniref:Uncharacterized protein n=1 Tax=bioreactor metagenome TaxID=1076179 RepID=A0A645IV88_9ZZZZ